MEEQKSTTYCEVVGCGHLYIVITEENGQLDRIFLYGDMSRNSDCGGSWFDLVGRLLTYSLRRTFTSDELLYGVLEQLEAQRCNKRNISTASSCADAIHKALEDYYEKKGYKPQEEEQETATAEVK